MVRFLIYLCLCLCPCLCLCLCLCPSLSLSLHGNPACAPPATRVPAPRVPFGRRCPVRGGQARGRLAATALHIALRSPTGPHPGLLPGAYCSACAHHPWFATATPGLVPQPVPAPAPGVPFRPDVALIGSDKARGRLTAADLQTGQLHTEQSESILRACMGAGELRDSPFCGLEPTVRGCSSRPHQHLGA